MNKQRRQDLSEVIDLLDDAITRLGEIRDEEQDAFDNLPEGLQCTERGEKMQDAIDAMDEVESDIQDVQSKVQDIISA